MQNITLEKGLKDLNENRCNSCSAKSACRLEKGYPADEIIKTAKEGSFDLIVVGNRGLGNIEEVVLGGVSDRVADKATCPVLIVK